VISAADILDGRAREGLSGLIVLVGTSAPEAGGLRIGHSGALVPSVALHAQAVTQLLSGLAPRRPAFATLLEAVVCAAVAAIGLLAAARLPPGPAGLIAIGTSVAWLIMVCAALAVGTILLDPLSVPLAGLGSYGIVALLAAAQTRRREDALRRRFEQHLAPEIVRRIVANPDLLRLAGEQREVTALFTDVEGFTAMTERAAPDRLIAALDRYFETLCAIVVRHGGMVEKIVGDGLHALFNAPLDLPDHASRALACAEEIAAFGRSFSKQPDIAEIGFGRTRVGLETGIVVVGDVGGGGRLDYTAHGNAMNTAARLEAANKDLGTTICIGGRAARQIGAEKLRPLGSLNVRGRAEPLDIYEPWPIDMTAAQRAAYASGIALIGHDRPAGLKLIEIVALERLHDRALAKVLERLRARQD
jgi:adenylate cyclase